jgi:hypothetical protein
MVKARLPLTEPPPTPPLPPLLSGKSYLVAALLPKVGWPVEGGWVGPAVFLEEMLVVAVLEDDKRVSISLDGWILGLN